MSRNVRRRVFIQSGVAAGAVALAGCSGGNDPGTTEDDSSTEGDTAGPTVALSVPTLGLTFFARMENAFNNAIAGGSIAEDSAFYDAGGSQSTQVSDIETAISNDVDAIMIAAITEEGITSAVEQANDADIPVIAIDRDVTGGETITYIASDNVQLGERSTELCLDFMQATSDAETYNILQLEGTPGASTTNDRGEGFANAVAANDNLAELDSQTGEFSTQDALSTMEDFITQYGDTIDGVFCQNDLMALGVHQALQDSELSVPVTGIDGTEAWVERFADNSQYGTLAQLPEEMVSISIEQAKRYLADEDIEDTITVEGREVTQDNATEYLTQYFDQ